MKYITTLALTLLMTTSIMAQEKKYFTIDDLIPGGKTYYQQVPQNAWYEWWGDTPVQLDIETTYSVKTDGSREKLFTLADINTALSSYNAGVPSRIALNSLYNVTFPYPKETVAMFDIRNAGTFMVDWVKCEVVWFAKGSAQTTDFNAVSKNTAMVSDHNLSVRKANGETAAISTDGSIDIVYGESVHRNEFGISKGTFWSPNGELLAFYRMDQSMVTTYPQVNISARTAELMPDKYPMAGETSHKVTVGIYDVNTGKTIYLDAGDPTDRYFTNISWSPDNKSIYMIELNRDQTDAQLVRYNASTGKREALLFEEHNDKYVEPMHPIQFLPWDADKFVYLTRKDGYLHFYLYNTEGKQLAQLTRGNWEVINFLGFNKQAKTIIYTSNAVHPLQNNLFSVDMKGRITRLDNGEGWHNAKLSDNGTYVIDNYSSPTIARKIDLTATDSKHKTVNLLTASDPWDAFKVPEMKVGTLKAADGKTDLYYRLILPTDFDPAKKYPAVIYVYGGPHAHNVDASRNWGVRGWDIWMAQQGYVMFCIDNRGSEHRGLDFEQATFRQLGVEEMKDQVIGAEYLQQLPYVDAERIGVHGWSFGGFMTTSLLTTYPDIFKVGVAGGPVIDWKFYEVMYGERYMDTPQSNPEGYAKTSLLNKADKLKGHLLIIYGDNDNTCVPQHTLSFIKACIDANTYPDLFIYPGHEHNMIGIDRVHLHNKITQYFNDYLK